MSTKDQQIEGLLDTLYDICGAKRRPQDQEPVKLTTRCPYCESRFESLYALDHHIEYVHNSWVD